MADEVERPFQNLQSSDDDVQIHAVDGFHFQNNVRRVSSSLRRPAWEFTDFLPLSFHRLEPAC